MYRVPASLLICALALSACASERRLPPSALAAQGRGVVRVDGDKLPAPSRADYGASSTPYLLGPFDELAIDVYGVEELQQKAVQVDASGRLSFPLAGTIEVSGKTPEEVARIIDGRLRGRYVRDPRVTVNLTEMASQIVTVEGEVEKPGNYPIIGRMSLLRAIAAAEGVTEFSKLQDVVILRRIEGRDYAGLYNLRAIRRGLYDDPDVYPGDVVMVDESRGRRIFRDFLQLAPLLSAPLIVALQ